MSGLTKKSNYSVLKLGYAKYIFVSENETTFSEEDLAFFKSAELIYVIGELESGMTSLDISQRLGVEEQKINRVLSAGFSNNKTWLDAKIKSLADSFCSRWLKFNVRQGSQLK